MPETDSLLRVVEDVTFAQLRTFACAAGSGGFAKAAEQLDISQPAVSEQIKMLEGRLGHDLFERRRGGHAGADMWIVTAMPASLV